MVFLQSPAEGLIFAWSQLGLYCFFDSLERALGSDFFREAKSPSWRLRRGTILE